MNHTKLLSQMVSLFLIVLVSSACGTAQPSTTPVQLLPTPVPSTPTPVPPTITVAPTATPTLSPAMLASLRPSPRGYVSMAYDAESDRIILFGGQTGDIFADPANYNGETWAYNVAANQWRQMKPPSGPTRRGAAELAYDTESDRIILFGGANDVSWDLNDTWAYDYNTNTWKQMAPGPHGHLGDRLAYDAESDRIILFGGDRNDTWAYDFNSDTWTEMKPTASPSARNFQSMVYDAKADRVFMWGGDARDQDLSVWAYDYNTDTWQKLSSQGKAPRFSYYISSSYNTKADLIILYGGGPIGDDGTWTFDYNTKTWLELKLGTTPSKLSRHAMVYSPRADRVILFGGQVGINQFDYTGQTWSYDLNTNTWTNVIPES